MSASPFKTEDFGSHNVLQPSSSIDKDIAGVDKCGSIRPLYANLPETLLRVPVGSCNGVLQFDILHETVLLHNVFEILPDMLRLRVVLGPKRVGFPCELICRRWDIASTARVSKYRYLDVRPKVLKQFYQIPKQEALAQDKPTDFRAMFLLYPYPFHRSVDRRSLIDLGQILKSKSLTHLHQDG